MSNDQKKQHYFVATYYCDTDSGPEVKYTRGGVGAFHDLNELAEWAVLTNPDDYVIVYKNVGGSWVEVDEGWHALLAQQAKHSERLAAIVEVLVSSGPRFLPGRQNREGVRKDDFRIVIL